MKVIFYKAEQGNWADMLIAWWTSPFKHKLNRDWLKSYSHVELLFSDGMMFSASYQDNAVRMRQHSYSSNWDSADLYMSTIQEFILRASCERMCNMKYDYMGLTWFVLRLPHNKSKYFCSELVAERLQTLGYFAGEDPSHLSPNDLARKLLLLPKG